MLWLFSILQISDTSGNIKIKDQDVVISGNVNGDVSIENGSLVILEEGEVKGSVSVFGDSCNIFGKIRGNLSAISKSIVIKGSIYGDVSLIGLLVKIKENGYINGNVSIVAANFENKGEIEGEKSIISINSLPFVLQNNKIKFERKLDKRISILILLLSLFVITFLIFLFSKRKIDEFFERFRQNPLKTIITGLAILLIIIPILPIVLFLVFGFVLLAFTLALIVGSIALIITIIGIIILPFYLIAILVVLLIIIFLTLLAIPIYVIIALLLIAIGLTYGIVIIGKLIAKNDYLAYAFGFFILAVLTTLSYIFPYISPIYFVFLTLLVIMGLGLIKNKKFSL